MAIRKRSPAPGVGLAALGFSLILLSACGGSGGSSASDPAPPAIGVEPLPPENPTEETTCNGVDYDSTYDALQKTVFDPHCVQCHSGPNPTGGLDLSAGVSYANIYERPSRSGPQKLVAVGDKSESLLYLKIAAWSDESLQVPGASMPPAGPLPEREARFLQFWVSQGAPSREEGTIVGTEDYVDGCLNAPNPVEIKPLEAPELGTGVQVQMPPYVIEAASEVEVCFCTYFDVRDQIPDEFKTADEHYLFWDANEIRQNSLSHHLLIQTPFPNLLGEDFDPDNFSGWACRGGPSDGAPCDPMNSECGTGACATPMEPSTGCSGYGPANGTITATFAGTQKAQSKTILDPGVFQYAPTSGIICWNSHAFNLTTQPAEVSARLNFYFAAERIHQARSINTSNTFGVPDLIARGAKPYTRNTLCWSQILPRGARLFGARSHNHKRGERAWWTAADKVTVLYENRVYNDPPEVHFRPALEFDSKDEAERTLEFCTTYNNGVDENGEPDPETVTRASRIEYGVGGPGSTGFGTCEPHACVNDGADFTIRCDDGVRNQRGDDAACDTSPGAGDGWCDACSITGGVVTEAEMGQGSLDFYTVDLD